MNSPRLRRLVLLFESTWGPQNLRWASSSRDPPRNGPPPPPTRPKSRGYDQRVWRITAPPRARPWEPKHNPLAPNTTPRPPASAAATPAAPAPATKLAAELFPDLQPQAQPREVGRLALPDGPDAVAADPGRRRTGPESGARAARQQKAAVLALSYCSTELSEADFRQLLPRGKHIESWVADGEFYRIIPGRDPLTLERQPFYMLLFQSARAALAYQANAVRLHRLAQLYHPSSAMSAILAPERFLQDEDPETAWRAFNLVPPEQPLHLELVDAPHNAIVSDLIQRGGYHPVVSDPEDTVPRVLLHLDGVELAPAQLHDLIYRDGQRRMLPWPLRGDRTGVRRLRDLVDVTLTKYPYTAQPADAISETAFAAENSRNSLGEMKLGPQTRLRHVYNRWIIEFEDTSSAQRFVRAWNQRLLRKDGEAWDDPGTTSASFGDPFNKCYAELLW